MKGGSAAAAELGMKPLMSKLATLWASVAATNLARPLVAGDQGVARADVTSPDPLTGLLDRPHLMALISLDLELLRTRRMSVGMVRLDLDDFGAVNDSHGSAAGTH